MTREILPPNVYPINRERLIQAQPIDNAPPTLQDLMSAYVYHATAASVAEALVALVQAGGALDAGQVEHWARVREGAV